MPTNPLAALSAADCDAAIDGFIADYLAVVGHVLLDSQYPWCRSLDALVESVERRELAALPLLGKAVAWTLFIAQWNRRFRRLTPAEIDIEDAAWRISDALHGGRKGRR